MAAPRQAGAPKTPPSQSPIFPDKISMSVKHEHAGALLDPDMKAEYQADTTPSKEELIPDDDSDSASDEGTEADSKKAQAERVNRRNRFDVDVFQSWLRDDQQKINDQNLNEAIQEVGPADKRIIDSAREYQVELFERAKEKNTIAVLNTGTGKTLIAVMLMRHAIAQDLMDQQNGLAPRISFFLVDKVTLVEQQWRVLQANLSHPVSRFSGDRLAGIEVRQEFWKHQFESNKAIVCTAAVLQDCLHRSFFTLDQIDLLVFDEAHHAKKNHPYARIIKDFYADAEKRNARRPRIFGMTASPVDAKTDFLLAATQLETLLHSEIATVDPDRHELLQPAHIEIPVEYRLAPAPFGTALWSSLHALIGHNECFRKLFEFTKGCTRELGIWCADRTWHLLLTRDEMSKAKAKTERKIYARRHETEDRLAAAIDTEIAVMQQAYDLVESHVQDPLQKGHLTHKVEALQRILKDSFQPGTDKCIIFVTQRLTAILLVDLLMQPWMGLEHIVAGTLLGSGSNDAGEQFSMSQTQQTEALAQLRTGEINCLVATNIAEEGIDVPDCNMVVRFDLFNTMIQYIQSKGRARIRGSRYFYMIDADNEEHKLRMAESRQQEAKLRDFCLALPSDRLLRGNDFDMDYFLRKEPKRIYTDKTSGAKLTYRSSLVVLAAFVGSLEHSSLTGPQAADYVVKSIGREFQAEVILPDSSPIKSVRGEIAASKQVAKCSAAFNACLALRKKAYLDEWLQSTFRKQLPKMRNARLALSSKKRQEYPVKMKPDIWSIRGLPDQLHVAVFWLANPDALGRASKPLGMLTRLPLSRIPGFPIFFGNGQNSVVKCSPVPVSMPVSSNDVDLLTLFTLRIFEDVFSKTYKPEPEKLPYYLAPVSIGHGADIGQYQAKIRDLLDWDCLASLQSQEDGNLEDRPHHFYRDRYVTDPHDGSRKFYTFNRVHGLRPSDSQLQGAPKGANNQRKARKDESTDIWNYSVSLWSKSRARLEKKDDLAVVEAEYLPLRRNLLDEFEKPFNGSNRCYICFATLRISPLPTDIVAMAYNLPAIVHRLDSNLIAMEACRGLGLDLRPELALEALTKDSDNTSEHAEEQINFQKGMGNNYERLEFLGDSFLKMSTTIALFVRESESDEQQYHIYRMLMVCNKNLFNNALELKLEESIRSKSFNRRLWYPEGLEQTKGKQINSILGKKGAGRGVHVLADKSIADVCEALIGAAYLTTYEQGSFDLAVQAVTKFVANQHHTMRTFADFHAEFVIPGWQTAEPTAVHLHLARQMETTLGYRFRYPRLLRSAFTHPSYSFMYEHIPHYQRLEFLGDALLDMVCVDHLFHRFPGADPQWLTEHKMAMVSNQFLGCLSVELGFHRHMMYMSGHLPSQIAGYVETITAARDAARREAVDAGRPAAAYARDFWTAAAEPPKCLPDLVEAYLGAVFVDSGFDYAEVRRFFAERVLPYFADMRVYDTFANKHPTTHLAHVVARHFACARLRFVLQEVPVPEGRAHDTHVVCGVMVHGHVVACAPAASGRYAKTAAAKKAAVLLGGMSIQDFKAEYKCRCTAQEVDDASEHLSGPAA